jgi:hypothetical protein
VRDEVKAAAPCKLSPPRIAGLHRRRSHTIVKATKTAVTTATHSGGIPIAISITAHALKNKIFPKSATPSANSLRGSFEFTLGLFVNSNSYSPRPRAASPITAIAKQHAPSIWPYFAIAVTRETQGDQNSSYPGAKQGK